MTATVRQKQFLRALGCKDVDSLSKDQASSTIESLLEKERVSGKTFPCPYCKTKFGPRPKRTKKCPSCGNTIVHLSGRFYTENQVAENEQQEWLKECRTSNKETVREDWKDEKESRKEFKEKHFVGYLIRVCSKCTSSNHLNGLLVTFEDAIKSIELLPPYEECRHETRECEFDPVSENEIPRGTRIAQFVDSKKSQPASSKTPKKSKRGCFASLMMITFVAVPWWILHFAISSASKSRA